MRWIRQLIGGIYTPAATRSPPADTGPCGRTITGPGQYCYPAAPGRAGSSGSGRPGCRSR
jgi:hypothetical protein